MSLSSGTGQGASAMPAIADRASSDSRSSSVRSASHVRKDAIKRSSSVPRPQYRADSSSGPASVTYQQMNAVYNEAPNAQLIHATASEVMHSRTSEQETVRQAEQHVHQIHSEAAQAVNQIRTEATQAVTEAFVNSQSQVSRTQLEATQHVAELQPQFQAREHEFRSQVQRLQKEADDSRRETESMRFKSQNAAATNEGSLQSKIEYLHGNMCRIDKELQNQKNMLSQFMESFNLLGERIDQLDQWYEEPQPPADNDEELIPTKQNSRSLISLLVPKDFSRQLVQW